MSTGPGLEVEAIQHVRFDAGTASESRCPLDCCDREIMSYVATTAAITGEIIRDLMAVSVERRFGAIHP